jgi:hypothetical protein
MSSVDCVIFATFLTSAFIHPSIFSSTLFLKVFNYLNCTDILSNPKITKSIALEVGQRAMRAGKRAVFCSAERCLRVRIMGLNAVLSSPPTYTS